MRSTSCLRVSILYVANRLCKQADVTITEGEVDMEPTGSRKAAAKSKIDKNQEELLTPPSLP
jgi:hypothetical protein